MRHGARHLFRTLLMALLMLNASSAMSQQAGQQARIQFDSIRHSFPATEVLVSAGNQNAIATLANGKPAILTHTFTYTNVGQSPLVIHRVTSLCNCTSVEFTKEPVMPGKQGQVTVTYNGTGKHPGHFSKAVTVYTNGAPETQRLSFNGDMTAATHK